MTLAWGKFEDGLHHPLGHHCADVAACFEALAALPVFRDRLHRAAGRSLDQRDIARLSAIVFLHDTGKLHPGFQAKGWPAGTWRKCLHGHVQEGLAVLFERTLREFARAVAFDAMNAWDCGCVLRYASICHHGRPASQSPASAQRWERVPANGYDPLTAAHAMGKAVRRWFAPAFVEGGEPLPVAPAFQHLFCGLVVLADWLGSSRSVFAFEPAWRDDYLDAVARPRAREAVRGIGLDTRGWRAAMADAEDFTAVAPGRKPRPAQECVGRWPVDDPLIVLEAETGSGKTEAALWRFARLFAAGKVDGLYFAVPTRAAAKQLHGRVNEALRSLFGADAPEAALAVPGYIRAGEVTGQALPNFNVLWDDEPDAAVLLRRWAAENTKRCLAATVAVGAVDQAMLGSLEVKHAHLRAASLSRSLLVIDEVHASDRYMFEAQANLLQAHLAWGGYAMLMSATLGASARTRWLGGRGATTPDFAAAVAAPYPAVWGSNGQASAVTGDGTGSKGVRMELAPDWDVATAAALAADAARQGARVLVIRNTVADAVATLEAVRAGGDEALLWQVADGPALHHSRFAAEDRLLLDEKVQLALSGEAKKRPAGGVIVIGTQTLEQSLDICADHLITDLCPMDVLLQRIGRLHRHNLPRPRGFEQPCCTVLSPAEGLDGLAEPSFAKGLGAWKSRGGGLQGVYLNLPSCELTRRLVTEQPEWRIPDMNRWLVESATHDEAIQALCDEKGAAWEDYWKSLLGKGMAEQQAGRSVVLNIGQDMIDFDGRPRCFASDEEAVRTRLGAEGERITLPEGTCGPFGKPISVLTLPAHWRVRPENGKGVQPVGLQCGSGFSIFSGQIAYGREGVRLAEVF